MKQITKYQANDGSEWNDESKAIAREELIRIVDAAMAPLGSVPADVESGKGWLQHNLETVNVAKDRILDICREQGMSEYPAFKCRGRDCHPQSIIGRILSEVGGPLWNAWHRFGKIDTLGREHQQPYFAYTNGPDADHYCVESRA